MFKQLLTNQLSLPMAWYTTYYLQPDLNWGPPSSQGSALTLLHHKKSLPKPLQLACAHNSQKSKHTLQQSLRLLMEDENVKLLAEIFMIDVRILYGLVVKISDFFIFLKFICHFKSCTCSICMANFQAWFWPWWWSLLDLSFINKINLTKSSF